MKKYGYIISYIRQSILRYGKDSKYRMDNVGIKLTQKQVAAIILKLENLTIPKEVCYKNRYWDPFVLEKIYTDFDLIVPKTPFEKGAKNKLDKILKWLRDKEETAFMYNKYIPSLYRNGRSRSIMVSLGLDWANGMKLYDIFNNDRYKGDSGAEKIDETIELLQQTISFNIPLLLKPIYDIKNPESSFLVCMQLGAINNIARSMIEMGIPRETSLYLFEKIFLDFKDVINELENRSESLEIDVKPEVINNLRDKVNKMNALYAKHNVNSVAELIEIREQLSHEQNSFSDIEFEIENIKVEIENKIAEMTILAQKLSANRKKSAPKFSEKIEGLLKRLGLEKAKIEIQLSDKEDFVLFGKEGIDILFQANTGFPMKPIQTAISGGERSRVMLAVKKIIAENLELPTLILDEIDTGVSGKVADEIGKLMKEMATDMQLIVITHLAQVASKGNNNYKVLKQDVDGRTKSTIIPLSKEEKLLEIAQLLSGEKITEAALEQARELIG